MDMNEVFFSIIIPVYNTERYLSRCLDSFCQQSFDCKKIEVVIVNDASPNVAQCDEVFSLYKDKLKIQYIKLDENQGTHIARTRGVENSTGKYLLFIDPDDFLVNDALKILYNDIQTNGNADYIWFLFKPLYKDGKMGISGFIEDVDAINVLEDMLTFKVSHNVANKCFNASFAKEHWMQMVKFYSVYNEDYYQMAILHYLAKTKRIINEPLYVYVQDVGITGVVKYEMEKLKRTILSIYNVDKNLCEFYQTKNASLYIPLVQNYSDGLYIDCIFRSSVKEFIDAAKEMIGGKRVETVLAKYIIRLQDLISMHKRREKYFLPVIACCSFVCKLPQRQENKIDVEHFINLSSATFKDDKCEKDILECISYLETELSFYQRRARFYAPVKFVLKPFWRFFKKIFRR